MKHRSLFSLLLLVTGLSVSAAQAATPLSINGKLSVSGLQLVNQCGNPVQLRGVSSHGLQWYGWAGSQNVCLTSQSMDFMANTMGADLFRAAMYVDEGGYMSDQTKYRNMVNTLVTEAGNRGMYIIIDWHILNPGNPNNSLAAAQSFWTYMSQQHANKDHVIYEICNEPNGVNWATVKQYADAIIPLIRANDPDAVISVGTPNWSQLGAEVVANKLSASYGNIMYTFHFYAGTHATSMLTTYVNQLPIFVTEWGTGTADGNGAPDQAKSQAFIDIMGGANSAGVKISWANWSFADKNEGSAELRPGTCAANSWDVGDLTTSGGWIRNWMQTPADNFVCSGANTPTFTRTRTRTATLTATPVANTATFTRTVTRSVTQTNTPVPNTATSTHTRTVTRSSTPTNTTIPNTFTSTATRTVTATSTPVANTSTSTATRSVTRSVTQTNTPLANTATVTATRTATATNTVPANTSTSTATRTATRSVTQTNTPLANTATITATRTATATNTVPANTSTSTATRTATRSVTQTNTPVATTATSTATRTATATNTVLANTSTSTATRSVTQTNTPVANTVTSSATRTVTRSATQTSTAVPNTFTSTVTSTVTRSSTPTNTTVPSTLTPTATRTATRSVTQSVTPVSTATSTATRTATSTVSPSPSVTATYTDVPAGSTLTVTPSVSPTNSHTPSITATSSITVTFSSTATATSTVTETFTSTVTPSSTQTSTATPVNSSTRTATPSSTASHTPVSTGSATAISTATSTASSTGSATLTAGSSSTFTATPTRTSSVTAGASATRTPTPSQTRTAVAPTLVGLSSSSGPEAGGNIIAIYGSNFVAGAVLLVDGSPVTVTYNGSGQLTVTMPPHASAMIQVQVQNPDGQLSGPRSYIYVALPPTSTHTPIVATPAPTSGPDGPVDVDQHSCVPNPWSGHGPGWVSAKLAGRVDRVKVKFYSKAMVCLGESELGASGAGWVRLPLPEALRQASSGTYYYLIEAERDGQKNKKKAVGILVVLK